jgi:serine/threonine-protein kinase HipA
MLHPETKNRDKPQEEFARRIGLDVAEAWAERIGNVPCLISKRYDRVSGSSGEIARRLHQEDFCQALG